MDALLAETSVTSAARRLRLSPSATGRTLARLRAGRGLVPTPRAAELRDRLHVLARDARDALGPLSCELDVATLERGFTIRAGEGFGHLFAAPLWLRSLETEPRVRLRFVPKPAKPPTLSGTAKWIWRSAHPAFPNRRCGRDCCSATGSWAPSGSGTRCCPAA